MEKGQTYTWSRIFIPDDVYSFSAISGDEGEHHIHPDAQGRLMVQGLLTATLPSKIGGDINFIASEMRFQFHRPVFTGDSITCVVTIDELEPLHNRTRLNCGWICSNQEGEVVMTGGGAGVVHI